MKYNFIITNCVIILYHLMSHICCKRVAVKIVEEPTNYGMNIGGFQAHDETNKLQMRITPSNFSGPVHLKRLAGTCFHKVIDTYKYELCPFSNITQHEQSLRWNPYSGVLGVWQEWEIENNTFTAMVMGEGDSCGSLHRRTKILLRCGEQNSVSEVSEPSTCNYQMVFKTPLVCHPHSLLVYPTLSKDLQREWGEIEGQLEAETVTQQGYKKLLHRLFEKAGYILPDTKKKQLSEAAKIKEDEVEKSKEATFQTLYQCQNEYKKLQEEIEGLRMLLRVNGLPEHAPAAPSDDKNPEIENRGDYDQHNPYQDYQWMHEDD